jgi:hypothetical protein
LPVGQDRRYSPNFAEYDFCEVRVYGVLGSSSKSIET